MIFCSKCDGPDTSCCDFCRYYDFNANEDGAYCDRGWCRRNQEPRDPGSLCEDFHCVDAIDEACKEKKMKSLGQLAWEAYAKSVGGLTFDGKPLPTWLELGDRQRLGWEAAAEAIRIEGMR